MVDNVSIKRSKFVPKNTTIKLSDFNVKTFFHELTHLLSYFCCQFNVPKEYIDFKNKFLSSPENISNLFSLAKLCEEDILKTILIAFGDISNNNILSTNEMTLENFAKNIQIRSNTEIIQDMIDALTNGELCDFGLTYTKDLNTNIKKTEKSSGHGCEYFKNINMQFEEIIADYLAISIIDPDNKLFTLFKSVLGDDFVMFLDNRCKLITGSQPEFDYNNDHKQKK